VRSTTSSGETGSAHGLLAAGALLRVAALPLPGTGDVHSWKIWSFAASTDPAGAYEVGGTPPERRVLKWKGAATTTDYPPLSIYELAIVGRLYWSIDPLYRDSPALTAAVKAPGIVAEIVFVAVLLTWGRRRFGPAAQWAALAFWINPAILMNGAVLMAAINLYVFYGFGEGWPPALNRRWTGVDFTVWLALINVGVFAWATLVVARRNAGR
jgi:hypothetical protein